MKTLMNRLKNARDNKGVSQTQVYKDIGINNKTLSGYERGISEPDVDTIKILADYYNVSLEYLLGKSDTLSSPKSTKEDNDISTSLDRMKKQLATSDSLMFDGQPATEEQVQAILNAIEMGEAFAKQRAKEKFTPKKYRK